MVQITGMVYDGGLAGGDSNVTQQTAYVNATGLNDRVTTFLYDFRDRQTDTDGEIDFYARQYFDNLDRIVRNERYNTTLAGNLIIRRTATWDDRGAAFQAATYAVDPSTGAIGNTLVENTWRDPAGNIVKSLPAGSQLASKAVFDSINRLTTTISTPAKPRLHRRASAGSPACHPPLGVAKLGMGAVDCFCGVGA